LFFKRLFKFFFFELFFLKFFFFRSLLKFLFFVYFSFRFFFKSIFKFFFNLFFFSFFFSKFFFKFLFVFKFFFFVFLPFLQTTFSFACPYSSWGPSIQYATLFWPILTPSLCHTLSHIPGPPQKYVTHLAPRFLVGLVQTIRTKAPCTNSFSIVGEGFCPGAFARGSFVWMVLSGVVFVRTPFCQNTSVTTES